MAGRSCNEKGAIAVLCRCTEYKFFFSLCNQLPEMVGNALGSDPKPSGSALHSPCNDLSVNYTMEEKNVLTPPL
jgi:hypothetical protein